MAKRQTAAPSLGERDRLQQFGLQLLENGVKSHDTGDVILSLYGIGLSVNDDALHLITNAIQSSGSATHFAPDPAIQLTAVQLLAHFDTEESNALLCSMLKSDIPLIYLEALQAIATRQLPSAYAHIEALSVKIDPSFRPFIPELLALDGSPASLQMLRRLLRDRDPFVRVEAVHALGAIRQTDARSDVTPLLHDASPAVQEALIPITLQSHSKDALVAISLAVHGHDQPFVEQQAAQDNLFALTALGKMANPSAVLYEKMNSSDLQVRLNATLALLEKKDPACLPGLFELFIHGPNDLVFIEVPSPGKTLSYYKATPSASEQLKEAPFLFEVSLRLREQMLSKTLELPEEEFLQIAELLFHYRQYDLVPLLVRLLENLRSEKAIALLQQQSECLGSPLIRAYCNVALLRLNSEGPYCQRLIDFVKNHDSHDIIQARPLLPWKLRLENNPYTITFEERSRLLIEIYEALALSYKEEAIVALLEAIKTGNPHNRYLLAGLLIRAIN